MEIYILCASDRFNYGDLLFPIITQKALSSLGYSSFKNIAIIKSDLSSIGALPTLQYNTLYNDLRNGEKGILIVAGGEVFGANWSKLYSFIYPAFKGLFKLLSNIERAIGKFLNIQRNPLPFLPLDERLHRKYHIIYHAVGGARPGLKKQKLRIQVSLQRSIYLSARENATYNSLKENYELQNIILTPDSAILMSDFYSFEDCKEDYIAFQIGHFKNGGKLELIGKELSRLSKKTNLPVRFIPIGNCSGHDDILSLKWLCNNADYPCEIVVPGSLEIIMKTIACSRVFIGTSLHGLITAMSFATPYIGINTSIPKIKNYLTTWAPRELNKVSDFSEIFDSAISAIQLDKSVLIKNAEYQKQLSRKSFEAIDKKIRSVEA